MKKLNLHFLRKEFNNFTLSLYLDKLENSKIRKTY